MMRTDLIPMIGLIITLFSAIAFAELGYDIPKIVCAISGQVFCLWLLIGVLSGKIPQQNHELG